MKNYLLLIIFIIQMNLLVKAQADMTLSATQTNSGPKTFLDGTLLLRNTTNTSFSQFTNSNPSNRIYTLPDISGTVLVSGGVNNLIGNTGFTSIGAINITSPILNLTPTEGGTLSIGSNLGSLNISGNHIYLKGGSGSPYLIVPSNLPATKQLAMPMITADDSFVFANVAQTLTNKTLISPTMNTLKIIDGNQGAGKILTSDASGLASWQPLNTQWVTNGTSINYQAGNVIVGASPVNSTGLFQLNYSSNTPFTGAQIKNGNTGNNAIAELSLFNNQDNVGQLFFTGSNYTANPNIRGNAAGLHSTGAGGISFLTSNAAAPIIFATSNITRMIVDPTGNVGIGTELANNPNGYKLAVNGKIGAKDVQVETSSATWPDYVFAPYYSLPLLSTVERYIKENNHLENVPSAAEIEKEGHNLGEMDKILLKKVEELTLYLIQQQKEIDELKKKLESK